MNQILDEHTRIIHQAQDYIERNLNQPLTVDELARVVSFIAILFSPVVQLCHNGTIARIH